MNSSRLILISFPQRMHLPKSEVLNFPSQLLRPLILASFFLIWASLIERLLMKSIREILPIALSNASGAECFRSVINSASISEIFERILTLISSSCAFSIIDMFDQSIKLYKSRTAPKLSKKLVAYYNFRFNSEYFL